MTWERSEDLMYLSAFIWLLDPDQYGARVSSVRDPDPELDPHVFGPPGSGSISHNHWRKESDPELDPDPEVQIRNRIRICTKNHGSLTLRVSIRTLLIVFYAFADLQVDRWRENWARIWCYHHARQEIPFSHHSSIFLTFCKNRQWRF